MFITADDLSRERLWLRLSLRDLARRADMPESRLSKLLSGRLRIQSRDRRSLSKALADRMTELRKETESAESARQQPAAA